MNLTGSNSQKIPSQNAIAVIPARLASTRLPGKALIELAGKPMVCWVAERARAAKNVSRVIIATDSIEIYARAEAHGIEVVMTDSNHASGTDRVAEVAESLPEAEIIVNVQGDEPLISPETIEQAVAEMEADRAAGIVTTWEPIESLGDLLNFDNVKVAVGDNGYALYFSRSPMPFPRDAFLRYGDPNEALMNEPGLWSNYRKHTGLYVYRRDVLLQFTRWPQTTLERYEGLEQLRAGLDELQRTSFVPYYPVMLAALAEGLATAGHVAQALTTIDEALTKSERDEERWWIAELFRIKAQLILLAEGAEAAAPTAEANLQDSLSWARRQEALSLELRSATDLARLWLQQGRVEPARDLLAPIYARFTEGFATADLEAAKALLGTCNASISSQT